GQVLNEDSEGFLVVMFLELFRASPWYSPPGFGLASCHKPRRALVLLRRLTLGARRLGDFVVSKLFKWICFCSPLPADGEIASRDAAPGPVMLQSESLMYFSWRRPA